MATSHRHRAFYQFLSCHSLSNHDVVHPAREYCHAEKLGLSPMWNQGGLVRGSGGAGAGRHDTGGLVPRSACDGD